MCMVGSASKLAVTISAGSPLRQPQPPNPSQLSHCQGGEHKTSPYCNILQEK